MNNLVWDFTTRDVLIDYLTELNHWLGGRQVGPNVGDADTGLSPFIRRAIPTLDQLHEDVAFSPLSQEMGLKGFFRYWTKARKVAMPPSGGSRTDPQ
jgi:hypothetical protein